MARTTAKPLHSFWLFFPAAAGLSLLLALWTSALCWSMAYGLVAIQLVALFRHSEQHRK